MYHLKFLYVQLLGYLVVYTVVVAVFLGLLVIRRRYQPLKVLGVVVFANQLHFVQFRAPLLVFICALSCHILVVWVCLFLIFREIGTSEDIFCGDAEVL